MESMVYPMKFVPQFFEKIWGGQKIKQLMHKDTGKIPCVGESWELSAIPGKVSVVAEGFLKDNGLDELIEIYMGDLVGEKVFEQFGTDFPLLVKFIDAQENLSVQVHPDDRLAQRLYGTAGKTEMWYVIQNNPGAGLYIGLKKGVTREDFLSAVRAGSVDRLLNFCPVQPGDVFFIPAGTVHSLGKGVMVAEVQQSSDCTYRIFDWNRRDANGNERELHVAEALEAIHFGEEQQYHKYYVPVQNKTVPVVKSDKFNVNLLDFNTPLEKVYAKLDSFIIYICTEGKIHCVYEGEEYAMSQGEVMLVPALATDLLMFPHGPAKVLEIYL
ncbi:MAG: class I mannose-6-phosphate isomerase [Bacteroidales bacterium]|nr:class I mannose-6-phosphate isomerase [Bacteroidales bacterium]